MASESDTLYEIEGVYKSGIGLRYESIFDHQSPIWLLNFKTIFFATVLLKLVNFAARGGSRSFLNIKEYG